MKAGRVDVVAPPLDGRTVPDWEGGQGASNGRTPQVKIEKLHEPTHPLIDKRDRAPIILERNCANMSTWFGQIVQARRWRTTRIRR